MTNIKRLLCLILGAILMLSLFGCARGEKYDLVIESGYFEGVKQSYHAGERVTLKSPLATDTDYTLYVDGESVNFEVGDNYSYLLYKFKMPDHSVTVELDSRNSMVYQPEDE